MAVIPIKSFYIAFVFLLPLSLSLSLSLSLGFDKLWLCLYLPNFFQTMRRSRLCHSSTRRLRSRIPQSDSRKNSDTKYKDINNGLCAPGSTPRTEPSSVEKPDKVVPLSGSPYFVSIVPATQVSHPFSLVVPKSFYPFLPSASVPLVFCCGNRSWELRYSGKLAKKRINTGWRDFAVDNELKIGDGCIYELMDRKNLKFRVQILRGKIPSEFAAADGRSSDSPVVIN